MILRSLLPYGTELFHVFIQQLIRHHNTNRISLLGNLCLLNICYIYNYTILKHCQEHNLNSTNG